MSKKEIIAKIRKFEKEYKTLNSKIEREFGEKNVFEEQYNKFNDQFMDEITKRSINLKILEDNINIVLLNMYSYICNKKLDILAKAHKGLLYKFIDDSVFKTKFFEIFDKLNEIAPEKVVAVNEKQVEEIRKLEKNDLKKLAIISEQSKKAKKNNIVLAVGIGTIFAIFGAIISNLDRISHFFIEMPTIEIGFAFSAVVSMFLGIITVFITGYILEKASRKKK